MGVIGKSELLESLYKIGEGKAGYKLNKIVNFGIFSGVVYSTKRIVLCSC